MPETDYFKNKKVLIFGLGLLGGGVAKECIFRIVNHVRYPDRETTVRIVGRAEGFASELWDELPDDPHMAKIERLEYLERKGKNKPR